MAVSTRMGEFGIYYGNDYNSSNYLNYTKMKINAIYIYKSLKDKGWTLNAIAGMLGNMQVESTLNPGIWQSNNVGNMSGGYGLVQWTPASKYINWLLFGEDPSEMDNNISRIIYELENGLQWISTSTYPMSFAEFSTSTQRPEYLAAAFVYNYERPASPNVNLRQKYALNWFLFLGGMLPDYKTSKHKFPWVIYANIIRKRN
ncbi:MAG: hypothetical protein II309_05060 [Bacilli bacterium]|nr:hypothetical protein [Bacilli bacterium]